MVWPEKNVYKVKTSLALQVNFQNWARSNPDSNMILEVVLDWLGQL